MQHSWGQFRVVWLNHSAVDAVDLMPLGLSFTDAVIELAVIPIAPNFVVADLNVGVLFFLAMSSLAAYSVIIGGWASNNNAN